MKQRIGRFVPCHRRAVMLNTHENSANEEREKSPEKHSMRKTGPRSCAAQATLGEDTGAKVVERVTPVNRLVIRPPTPPESPNPT